MDANDVLDILRMREVHLPYSEIGKVLQVSKQAVFQEAGTHLSSDNVIARMGPDGLEWKRTIKGEDVWIVDDKR